MIKKLYFPHDIDAMHDQKLVNAMIKHGPIAYAAFFMILEKLASRDGYLYCDYGNITYETRIDTEIIRSVVEDFELFEIVETEKGSIFRSKRLMQWFDFLDDSRKKKSEAGKKGMMKRWNNNDITKDNIVITEDNNGITTHNKLNKTKSNQIKLNKKDDDEKEIKEKSPSDCSTEQQEPENTSTVILTVEQPQAENPPSSSSPSSSFDTSPKDPYTGQSKERKVALKERKVEEPMHIPSYVRKAYNRETEEQYCDTLLNDEKYLTDTAITTNVPLYKIKEYVPIFIAHCRATEASHRSSGDFKSHFINYINKKEHNGKEQSKPSPLSSAERLRKNVDISNFRIEEYGKP